MLLPHALNQSNMGMKENYPGSSISRAIRSTPRQTATIVKFPNAPTSAALLFAQCESVAFSNQPILNCFAAGRRYYPECYSQRWLILATGKTQRVVITTLMLCDFPYLCTNIFLMDAVKKVPVNVFAEMTPNPATMKFVADKMLIADGQVAEYLSVEDTRGSSGLAEQLFQFPFVKGLFVAANFITVTKTDAVQWDMIMLEMRQFIKDYLTENDEIITQTPSKADEPHQPRENPHDEVKAGTEEEQQIIDLLEEYVRPAVESDGGAIHFKSYQDGVCTVTLRGACSGCPSSTATLKGGIENLLRSYLPELKEVVAEEL